MEAHPNALPLTIPDIKVKENKESKNLNNKVKH